MSSVVDDLAVSLLLREAQEQRLTVIEFGSGALARRVCTGGAECPIEEVVVVHSSKEERAELPDRSSAWSKRCRNAPELMALRRALMRADRRRVAIVSTRTGANVAHQLRLIQLFKSISSASLLVMVTDPPSLADRACRKAVFRVSEREQDGLTIPMLAFRGASAAERGRAWCDALVRVLGTGTRAEGSCLVASKAPTANTAPDDDTPGVLFPAVVLGVIDQLSVLKDAVDERVLRDGTPTISLTLPSSGGEVRAKLVRSDAARYVDGGYAALHYVPQPPAVHATCYELELHGAPRQGERVGYIALQAYGVEDGTKLFPTAVPWRMLHAAQVERLVVMPDWRGSGAKEALLSTCEAYSARGYAVRVKTGSERVANHTFMRCPLLAYEGHRPPGTTSCGVRRPMKRYARVLNGESPAGSASHGASAAVAPAPTPAAAAAAAPAAPAPAATAAASVAAPPSSVRPVEKKAAEPSTAADASPRVCTSATEKWRPSWSRNLHGEDAARPSAIDTLSSGGVRAPRGLINKLTADTFERILPLLSVSALSSNKCLTSTLTLLFQRASHEPLFCSLYASAAARLFDDVRAAEAASGKALPGHVAASITTQAFHESVEVQLRGVLRDCVAPQHDKGTGRLTAELVHRRLVDPASISAIVMDGSVARLCAYTAAVGFQLHRQCPEQLAALMRAVEAGSRATDGGPRQACLAILDQARRGWPSESGSNLGIIRTLGEVREEAADDLGLILAPVNAPSEKLRGLREGWVFWYVGHPTIHPESGCKYTFDEPSGRWAPVDAVAAA
jgi:ribosomal protein S18 acetylase RimI-like enzyme